MKFLAYIQFNSIDFKTAKQFQRLKSLDKRNDHKVNTYVTISTVCGNIVYKLKHPFGEIGYNFFSTFNKPHQIQYASIVNVIRKELKDDIC